jgi:hypothetical protein
MRFLLKVFSGLLLLSIFSLLAGSAVEESFAADDFHSRHSTDAVEAKAFQSLHFAEASVSVSDENYVVGRKRAISKALQQALQYALKALLGEEEYASNSRELGGVLRNAEDYVKSYRILYAADNQIAQTSDIKLEATFFYNVLANALSSQGLFSSNVKEKGILVLIRELSYTSSKPRPFWQLIPISETALTQKLIEAGANVIGRKLIQDAISEETITKALKGDLKVAAHIGLKAGADLVILGNAASSQRATSQEGEVSIQSNISLNVVSALTSALISARSEFAVAQNADPLVAEMEAFDIAAGQAVKYLWPTIQKVWNRELKEDVASPQSPATAPQSERGGDLPLELGEL